MDNELINPPPPVSKAKKLTLKMDVVALVKVDNLLTTSLGYEPMILMLHVIPVLRHIP
jgi:hypothetical protein